MGTATQVIALLNMAKVPSGEDYSGIYTHVNREEIMELRKKYKKQTGIVYSKKGVI